MKKTAYTLTLVLTLLLSAVAGTLVSCVEANPYNVIKYLMQIHITSPTAKTYNTNMIQLNISALYDQGNYKPWEVMYSLDDGPFEMVFSGESKTPVVPDDLKGKTVTPIEWLNLSDGIHKIVAKAIAGNSVVCTSVTFSINTVTPYLSIMSPENKTYETSDIPLDFTVIESDSPVFRTKYSLDRLDNVTITGNTTLAGLANGEHNLTVFAEDEAGNLGSSEALFFTVEEPTLTPEPSTSVDPNFSLYTGLALLIFVVAVFAVFLFYMRKNKH